MKKNICEVEDKDKRTKYYFTYIFELLETKCYHGNNVENNVSGIFSS